MTTCNGPAAGPGIPAVDYCRVRRNIYGQHGRNPAQETRPSGLGAVNNDPHLFLWRVPSVKDGARKPLELTPSSLLESWELERRIINSQYLREGRVVCTTRNYR